MYINNSVTEELKEYVIDSLKDGVADTCYSSDLHYILFNEDYYIIGYYQASEWLKKHDIDSFEAIGIIQEYEQQNFGEINTKLDNSESVVNMLVYILGENLLSNIKHLSKINKMLTEKDIATIIEEVKAL